MAEPAKPGHIYDLAEAGILPEEDVPRALAACGLVPDTGQWRRFFDRLFLYLGTTLLLAGVIFFFAWNWDDMGRMVKLGLVEGCLLAAILFAWQRGLDSIAGKVSLTGAAVLVGALLAVYGQVYQTGADAYSLFLTWFLLIIGWSIVARFAPLWLLLLVLGNVSLVLYWEQIVRVAYRPGNTLLLLVLNVLNFLAYLAWEEFSLRGFEWLTTRKYGVLAAAMAVGSGTIYAVTQIFDHEGTMGLWYLLLLGALFAYGYFRTRDPVVLALGLLSLVVTITSFVIEIAGFRDEFYFLFYGLLVVGLTALSVTLLRRIMGSWEETL